MNHRISKQALIKSYQSGISSFRMVSAEVHDLNHSPAIDFSAILAQKKPEKLIRAIPSRDLFTALKELSAEDRLEVMDKISTEQLTSIVDYDCWSAGELISQKVFDWLEPYYDLEPAKLYERFSELEEEYQLSALEGFIKVYEPDEYEEMADSKQDSLYSFPGQAFYYEILSDDERVIRFIQKLLESAMAENMKYAISLVAHLAYMPPSESLLMLKQFRNARVEEEGFLSAEDAMDVYVPLSESDLKLNLESSRGHVKGVLRSGRDSVSFIERVLEHGKTIWQAKDYERLRESFVFLANQLSVVSDIDPGQTRELRKLLFNSYQFCGFALEKLSNGDVEKATVILAELYPKRLFRIGVGYFSELRNTWTSVFARLCPDSIDQFKRHVASLRFGLALDWMDVNLGAFYDSTDLEQLKGLFNKQPLTLASQNLEVVGVGENKRNSAPHFLQFKVVDGVTTFEDMSARLQSLMTSTHVALAINEGHAGRISKVLAKGIASLYCGGHFISRWFGPSQLEKITAASPFDRAQVLERLVKNLVESHYLDLPYFIGEMGKNAFISYLESVASDLELAIEAAENDISRLEDYLNVGATQ